MLRLSEWSSRMRTSRPPWHRAGTAASVAAAVGDLDMASMRAYLVHMREADFSLQGQSTQWLEEQIVTAARSQCGGCDERLLHTWLTVRALFSMHHASALASHTHQAPSKAIMRTRMLLRVHACETDLFAAWISISLKACLVRA